LKKITDGYIARKERGRSGVVLNPKAWYRENIGHGEKLSLRILKEKTNPNRKSRRKYVIVPSARIERKTVAEKPVQNEERALLGKAF